MNTHINSLAIAGSAVFAATYWYGIYLSSDRGVNWMPVNTGLPANTPIFSLALSDAELFAGTRNHGVWRRPLGEMIPAPTWQLVFPPDHSTLSEMRFTFRWHPYFGALRYHIQSATDSLFLDGFLLNDTTAVDTIHSSLIDAVDSTWITPSEGNWYWRLRAYTAEGWSDWSPTWSYVYAPTAIRESIAEPLGFRLEQNYPNPFNPKTAVRFEVPGVFEVNLVVYDVLGREVAILVDERKAAGRYEVQFDGSALSSGIYICRMTAGSYVQARRIILIK
jgi:hypothetical protein